MMSLSKLANSLGNQKHKSLSLHEELRVIECLENSASVANICMEFGIAKQIHSDIRKKKMNVYHFVLKSNMDKESSQMKCTRLPTEQKLDDAVYKWCEQFRANGMNNFG